jgi:hypothetical protein
MALNLQAIGISLPQQTNATLWFTDRDASQEDPPYYGWQTTYGNVDSETENDDYGPYSAIDCACASDQTLLAVALNTKSGDPNEGIIYYAQREPGSWPHSGALNKLINLTNTLVVAVACTCDSTGTFYVCGLAQPSATQDEPYLWHASYAKNEDDIWTWTDAVKVSYTRMGHGIALGLTCAMTEDDTLHCVTWHAGGAFMDFYSSDQGATWQHTPYAGPGAMGQLPTSQIASIARMTAGSLDEVGFRGVDLIVFAVNSSDWSLWYITHTQGGDWSTAFVKMLFSADAPRQYHDVSCAFFPVDATDSFLSLVSLESTGTPYFMYFDKTDNGYYAWYKSLNQVETNPMSFLKFATSSWPWSPPTADDEDGVADVQDGEENSDGDDLP